MRARMVLLPFLLLSSFALGSECVAQVTVQPHVTPAPQPSQPQKTPQEQAAEVGKYSGPGSCAASNCHGGVQPNSLVRISQNEYSIWAGQDKHARAYVVLSNPVSIRMGKILGLEQPPDKTEKCLNCHALNARPDQRAETLRSLEDGVSCESCHGPAVAWLGPHTLKNWTHEQSLKLGMYDTRDLTRRTERCLTCHLGTSEKEVDHTMIAAGHPDLTFQLEAFSSAMPRHWKPAADASAWLNVQELAVGQAVQLREALNRLNRRAAGANWPEFAEYECFACHHSLTKPETSWRQADGYRDRQPGAPVWNPSTYAVFRHIAGAVDPATTTQLLSALQNIEQLSGKPGTKDQLAARAKDAAGLADRIAQEVQAQTYDRTLTAKLLQEICDDSEMISREGERSAEQATMALDSLSVAYIKNEQLTDQAALRTAINDLFQQLDNPSAYNAPRFAIQMQKVAALVPRVQARSSGGN
jgi:cytochrome c554/c'-like protein